MKKLKLLSIFLLLLPLCLVVLGAGCEDDDSISVCGVEKPLSGLPWLKDLKTTIEEDADISSAEIILYRLNNEDYIYIQKSVSSTHDIPNSIYDCEGNEKYKCGGNQPVDNCTIFFKEAQKIKSLWEKK